MVITVHLVEPNNQLLPGYERALTAGWSPETNPERRHGIREQHLCEISGNRERVTRGKLSQMCFKGRPASVSNACSSQRTKIICPRVESLRQPVAFSPG